MFWDGERVEFAWCAVRAQEVASWRLRVSDSETKRELWASDTLPAATRRLGKTAAELGLAKGILYLARLEALDRAGKIEWQDEGGFEILDRSSPKARAILQELAAIESALGPISDGDSQGRATCLALSADVHERWLLSSTAAIEYLDAALAAPEESERTRYSGELARAIGLLGVPKEDARWVAKVLVEARNSD
ncbi:MAG: hypothetical protein HY720_28835 [Planctomycetes bacterium]|nr:hypothetical protein [Planctomycetota bacterium]